MTNSAGNRVPRVIECGCVIVRCSYRTEPNTHGQSFCKHERMTIRDVSLGLPGKLCTVIATISNTNRCHLVRSSLGMLIGLISSIGLSPMGIWSRLFGFFPSWIRFKRDRTTELILNVDRLSVALASFPSSFLLGTIN